jgi:hypothetical protein
MLKTRRWEALTLALAGVLAGCPPLGDLGTQGGEAGSDAGSDRAAPHDAGGGDACTANPASDPRNCGRCGHDCLGGGCKGGVCQPYAIVTETKDTYGISIRSGALYFTTSFFTVETCAAEDCASTLTQMTSNQSILRGVTTDSTNVYWANAGYALDGGGFGGYIATCGLAGCPSGMQTILAPLESAPVDLVVNTSAVYWTDNNSGLVRMCSVGGCGQVPTTLVTDPTTLSGIAVDSTSLYWAESTLGNIIQCPLEGCTTFTPFAAGSVNPTKIDVVNQIVYWTTNGAIMSCPSSGCSGAPTVFAKDQPLAYGITDDGTNLYWTLLETSGKVLSCPLSGCVAPVVLGDMQASPWGVAVDATSVYWTNSTGSTVMRVMK